ncbi:MAG: dienelactone hydrolase family protein [Pyrinomonadaceae bacterium]|nr:dienelactone hydrolase family protein [Pyrinomonadaceae bacterium]
MCIECGDDEKVTRRTFLTSATAALAGVALSAEAAGQQSPLTKALDDPNIIKETVTYQSGDDNIEGYLARPKKAGRYRAVIIAHGNPGVSEDIKNAAAQIARAGFVALVYDWGSSAPMPSEQKELEKWRDYIFRYEFIRRQMRDVQAGIDYLQEQTFVKRQRVGMVGFCGGGRLALLFSSQSKDVQAIVSFYGAVLYHQRKHGTDPVPDVMDVVKQIAVPVQGHYGALDTVAPVADAKLFEKGLRAQGTPIEMYYYEGAGHSFYDFTRPQGSAPGFDHNPAATALAHRRMIKFLKRHLS